MDEMISESRRRLLNPYAFYDGDRRFEADLPHPPRDVHEARKRLGNQYAYLDSEGGFSEWDGSERPETAAKAQLEKDSLLGGKSAGANFSKREIEEIANRVLRQMWQLRNQLWPDSVVSPFEAIDPELALNSLGFDVYSDKALGQFEEGAGTYEVAGLLDRDRSSVHVGVRYAPEIRRFTLAHELGHVLLHQGTGLHRDQPLDGSSSVRASNPMETQANNFASYFLMPEKHVRAVFRSVFLTNYFQLTEETAFALFGQSLQAVQQRFRTTRDLSRFLASAESYNGAPFESLARQFKVSIEAMAIRLEELRLVEAV